MESVGLALTGIKAAKDIVSAIVGMKVDTEVFNRVIELQSQILNTQDHVFNIREDYAKIAKELEALKSWKETELQFVLTEICHGFHVYKKAPGLCRGSEGTAMYCAVCFNDKRLQILANDGYNPARGLVYKCQKCKSEYLDPRQQYEPDYDPPQENWRTI